MKIKSGPVERKMLYDIEMEYKLLPVPKKLNLEIDNGAHGLVELTNVGAFTLQPENSNMQCTVGGDYIATPSFTSSESDIHNRSGVQCTISGDYIATPSFTSSDIHKRSVLYTIEFQMRGLLHCHSLIWLSGFSKIDKDNDMDKYIFAEFPNPTTKADGYRVISELMIHGPYGYASTNSPCMKDGLCCDRNFPKPYYDRTFIDKDGYVHYWRRETGIDIQRQANVIVPSEGLQIISRDTNS
nr:DNA helicase [Tanacetum cinerariifolium]